MPILNNSFTCSNGHSFEANAKIRARCPECGVTAKRDFKAALVKTVEPKPEPKPLIKPEPKVTVKKPILLQQGRPRVMPVKKPVAKKPTVKPKLLPTKSASSGLVKTKRITARGTMPTITKRPIKTAPARSIREHGSKTQPYWHGVADKYGIGR
jgi:hypothetical protein